MRKYKRTQITMWTPERVKKLRNRYGESQEEFARRFRVSVGSIQTWEQGKGEPSGPATVVLDHLEVLLNERKLQTA